MSGGVADTAPSRPVLRWFGGKWLLAPWIIQHLPQHERYLEPFGGAASVLLRKPRSRAECINDLDHDIVNLFRVLRDPVMARELVRLVDLTPFARAEFVDAYAATDDPVEQARRLIVRSFMGFGANGASGQSTGFRGLSDRSGTTPAHDWANYPQALTAVVERLRGVVVENRPALDLIRDHDRYPKTLIYVDPPYMAETRGRDQRYRHEMGDAAHAALLDTLLSCRSMVVLSGYRSALYDDALSGWVRVDRAALADGARKRTECLWLNRQAWLNQDQQSLSEGWA